MTMRAASKIIALAVIVAICCYWTFLAIDAPRQTMLPPNWTALGPAELGNLADGIVERISDLYDALARVQALQAYKLAQPRPSPGVHFGHNGRRV